MAHYKLITLLLGMVFAAGVRAAEPSPFQELMSKHPQGIPWHVEVVDTAGTALGSLDQRITSQRASSCLGAIGNDGLRVEFTRTDALPPMLRVESYGAANVTGDMIKIDLTGGLCDAYLLMNGPLAADGSSSGDIYTFGMRGGHDVAKCRATVK